MKKNILLITMIIAFSAINAQVFYDYHGLIDEIWASRDFDMADIDGDNDIDLIISGYEYASAPTTKIYLNNGDGMFSESQELEEITGTVKFVDLDNDGDVDLIHDGLTVYSEAKHYEYTNDGNGHFTLDEVLWIPYTVVIYDPDRFLNIDQNGSSLGSLSVPDGDPYMQYTFWLQPGDILTFEEGGSASGSGWDIYLLNGTNIGDTESLTASVDDVTIHSVPRINHRQ